MAAMKGHQLYLRFLNVLHTLENQQDFPAVDADARRLLDEIALREVSGQSLTVTEAMGLSDIASPATLHRKLDILRQNGLIKHKFEGENRRTKHVVLTPLALKFFDHAGRAMQRSLKTS
jgi:DNA-binding MarR family transcriptional regulator